eukprot:3330692-Prymnesium_polylepis.1
MPRHATPRLQGLLTRTLAAGGPIQGRPDRRDGDRPRRPRLLAHVEHEPQDPAARRVARALRADLDHAAGHARDVARGPPEDARGAGQEGGHPAQAGRGVGAARRRLERRPDAQGRRLRRP